MLKTLDRKTLWMLSCTIALLSTGCATAPERSAFKSAKGCPDQTLHYCQTTGSGTRCGCVPTQRMEAILRSR
jgi:hypothetical protein